MITLEPHQRGIAHYTSRDLILYSFGVGCNPKDDPNEIKYLYEHDKRFSAFPTFLLSLPFRAADGTNHTNGNHCPSLGFGMTPFPPPLMAPPSRLLASLAMEPPQNQQGAVIHLGQKFRLHKQIPFCAPDAEKQIPVRVGIENRIISLRPHKNGTISTVESNFYIRDSTAEKNEQTLIATSQMVAFYPIRLSDGDTSTSTPVLPSSALNPVPFTKTAVRSVKVNPFASLRYKMANSQALLYRLSGDTNRIHVEGAPELFGTTHPILHGLCTLGYAVRAIISTYAKKSEECTYVECEFKRPLFVGDEIEIRMWEDKSRNDEKVVFFEARTTKNDEIVVDMGVASLSQEQKSLGRGSLNAKL